MNKVYILGGTQTDFERNWTKEGKNMIALLKEARSDAPALPLGERMGCPNYPSDLPKTIAQLGSWWEGTDQTLCSTYQRKAGRLVAFVPETEPWTSMKAWNRYWPAFSQAGTGLSDIDIQQAIDLLVGSI